MIWIADGATGRFVKFDLSGDAFSAFGKEGKLAGQFGWATGVACPNENTLSAAEGLNYRVQKLPSRRRAEN